MSSYYSQSFQYKLQGSQQSNYTTANVISGNSGGNGNRNTNINYTNNITRIASNSKRPHNARTQNNGNSSDSGFTDVTSNGSTKKMSDFKECGKQSTTYFVQKASGNQVGGACADYATTNGPTYNTNKYELQTPKINSHLLDHGYGATPQPTFNGNSNTDGTTTAAKIGYTKSSDPVITSYYKVSRMPALVERTTHISIRYSITRRLFIC